MVGFYRGRAALRRYVCASNLDRFCSLTARQHLQPACLAAAVRRFTQRTQRLRKRPYVWVAEAGRAKPHIHFFCSDDLAELLASQWTLGHTDIQRLDGLESMRAASNYAAKDFQSPLLPKRYQPARGFKPEQIAIRASSREEFESTAIQIMGGERPTSGYGCEGSAGSLTLGWGPGSPLASTGNFSIDRADAFYAEM